MKKTTTDLGNYLDNVKHIISCDLYELRLAQGSTYYYADTDKDVIYNGHIYLHNALLVSRQKTEISGEITVDTMTIDIHAGKEDNLDGKPFLQAVHAGILDKAVMRISRCFFRENAILGVLDLFTGNVEIKEAGGMRLQLTLKAKTQGLSQEFPIRKYYPQGSYTTNADGVIYSKETDAASLIAPFVPRKEVLI